MCQIVCLNNDPFEYLLSELCRYSSRKLFLVRGKKSYELCGAKRVVEDVISDLKCNVVEYFDFSKNPKYEDLERGLKLLELSGADVIIAIGGGSVLDMAKLIRFFHSYSGNILNEKFIKNRDLLPLFAIPTTAGTGSEVTHFAVLYKDNLKYSVSHKDMLPDRAIICPQFTYENTKYLTACTGFDALSQAIEAYWNVYSIEESDNYSIKAIKLIWDNLPLVIDSSTNELRDKIAEGAYWAGKAINITKTTAPHAFSYPFTINYDYPHGHAVALTFPFFMRYNYAELENKLHPLLNSKKHQKKMEQLYNMLGSTFDMIYDDMYNYLERIGLVINIERRKFDKDLILRGINASRLSNNPCVLSQIDVDSIVDEFVENGKL